MDFVVGYKQRARKWDSRLLCTEISGGNLAFEFQESHPGLVTMKIALSMHESKERGPYSGYLRKTSGTGVIKEKQGGAAEHIGGRWGEVGGKREQGKRAYGQGGPSRRPPQGVAVRKERERRTSWGEEGQLSQPIPLGRGNSYKMVEPVKNRPKSIKGAGWGGKPGMACFCAILKGGEK